MEDRMSDDEILLAAERIRSERLNPTDRGIEVWVLNESGIDQLVSLPDGQVVTVRDGWVPVELGVLCENPERVIRSSVWKQALMSTDLVEISKERAQEIWKRPGAMQHFKDLYHRKDKKHPAADDVDMPPILKQQIRILQDESLAPRNNLHGLFDADEDHAIDVLNRMDSQKELRHEFLLAAGEGSEERGWKRLASLVLAKTKERMRAAVESGDEDETEDYHVESVERSVAEQNTGRRFSSTAKPVKLDENNQPIDDVPEEQPVRGEQKVMDLKDVYNKKPRILTESGNEVGERTTKDEPPPAVST